MHVQEKLAQLTQRLLELKDVLVTALDVGQEFLGLLPLRHVFDLLSKDRAADVVDSVLDFLVGGLLLDYCSCFSFLFLFGCFVCLLLITDLELALLTVAQLLLAVGLYISVRSHDIHKALGKSRVLQKNILNLLI